MKLADLSVRKAKKKWKQFRREVWFHSTTSAPIFYTQLAFHWATSCHWGRHSRRVIYITNGLTSVRCRWCEKKLEPSAEELAAHPNLKMSREQLAAQDRMLEEVYKWLDSRDFR